MSEDTLHHVIRRNVEISNTMKTIGYKDPLAFILYVCQYFCTYV